MRGIAGFALLFVVLAALPRGTSAQADEEGASSESTTQEPVSEPAPEEPTLQLRLDDAGVGVTPSPPRTPDGYTLEEAEHRARNAKVGIGMSSIPLLLGVIALGTSTGTWFESSGRALQIAGGVLMGAGVAGLVGFGVMLGKRNSDLESLKSQQRRAQWDLATSRLVF